MTETDISARLKAWVKREKEPSRASFAVAIIFNLIFIYIINQIPYWDISFITPAWSETLWILNLSLVVAIVGNLFFLFYHRQWIRSLIQIVMNVFAFWAVKALYTVFPFSFSHSSLNRGRPDPHYHDGGGVHLYTGGVGEVGGFSAGLR